MVDTYIEIYLELTNLKTKTKIEYEKERSRRGPHFVSYLFSEMFAVKRGICINPIIFMGPDLIYQKM